MQHSEAFPFTLNKPTHEPAFLYVVRNDAHCWARVETPTQSFDVGSTHSADQYDEADSVAAEYFMARAQRPRCRLPAAGWDGCFAKPDATATTETPTPARQSPRKPRACPNCNSPVADHPEDGCVLAALIQVVRERAVMSEAKLRTLHAKTDADAFWNDVGRIADKLEEGFYAIA